MDIPKYTKQDVVEFLQKYEHTEDVLDVNLSCFGFTSANGYAEKYKEDEHVWNVILGIYKRIYE